MNIGAGCHPNKVKVSGPGVAKTGLKAFEPTYFTVDCTEAGQGNAAYNFTKPLRMGQYRTLLILWETNWFVRINVVFLLQVTSV